MGQQLKNWLMKRKAVVRKNLPLGPGQAAPKHMSVRLGAPF